MKNLIFINGTMGVGKTAVSEELCKKLEKNVFLDGDWCWLATPFVVTEETKQMVLKNISFLLNNFLQCTAYEHIIFCWVMQNKEIIDDVIKRLNMEDVSLHLFTLMASEGTLKSRLQADIASGKREEEMIDRSINRLPLYAGMQTTKIATDNKPIATIAEEIIQKMKAV